MSLLSTEIWKISKLLENTSNKTYCFVYMFVSIIESGCIISHYSK